MKARIYDFYTDIFPTLEEVEELCRPGAGAETCSWLILGGKGFECCCLHKPLALIDRKDRGEMIAMRDGCEKVYTFNPLGRGLVEVEF